VRNEFGWVGSSLRELASESEEGVEMGEAELDEGDEVGEADEESEEIEDWEEER